MRMLVFLLMVIVDGEEQGTQNMYFASINTCNYYREYLVLYEILMHQLILFFSD